MRRAWQAGRVLKLFTDEFRCPLPAVVTARATWELAQRGATGLFHLGGGERLSRFQIGELVAARRPQLHPRIERASIKDYQGAPRPADTSPLNSARIQGVLSFRVPGTGRVAGGQSRRNRSNLMPERPAFEARGYRGRLGPLPNRAATWGMREPSGSPRNGRGPKAARSSCAMRISTALAANPSLSRR